LLCNAVVDLAVISFFYATVMVNNDVHYMLYGQSASYAEGLQIEFMIHNATQD